VQFQDRTLTCVECRQPFAFTARDQEFHASKGFTNEPKRCRNCRQARKVQRGELPAETRQPSQRAGRPERPRSAASSAHDAGAVAAVSEVDEGPRSYTTTCNACGGEAVLNFEPTGNRAVLCSSCYDKVRAFA
jgi:CxxC-x17-CxxC domain-containing protein